MRGFRFFIAPITAAVLLHRYDNQYKNFNYLNLNYKFHCTDDININLKNYYQNFTPDFKIEDRYFNQLNFLENNNLKNNTPESNIKLPTPNFNVEISRSLNRFYCLNLLLHGDDAAYSKFIHCQPEHDRLNLETFIKLSSFIQQLSTVSSKAIEVLKASCFIAMCDAAKNLLKNQYNINYPQDSEQFLTYIFYFNNHPEIYEIYNTLDQDSQNLLKNCYLPHTHFRHVYFGEGGENMFEFLKKAVNNRQLTQLQLDLWFSRWLINIAGFRGHVNADGSFYLTQSIAENILLLKTLFDKLLKNPNFDILKNYLIYRAENLGLDINTVHPFLVRLATLMDLQSIIEGQQLKDFYDHLDDKLKDKFIADYNLFRTKLKLTPTYQPALLTTLKDLGCSIAEAAEIFCLIFCHSLALYRTTDQQNPLSFRLLAQKTVAEVFINLYRENNLNLTNLGEIIDINPQNGELSINQNYFEPIENINLGASYQFNRF